VSRVLSPIPIPFLNAIFLRAVGAVVIGKKSKAFFQCRANGSLEKGLLSGIRKEKGVIAFLKRVSLFLERKNYPQWRSQQLQEVFIKVLLKEACTNSA